MRHLLNRKTKRDRGATLVETAFVLPMLLVLVFGAVETGAAIIDWMAMSNASREGARVGALAGDSADADDAILRVVAQASCAVQNGELLRVRIYEADADGNQVGGQNLYALTNLNCDTGVSSFSQVGPLGWPSGSRGDTIGNLDRLAIEVEFEHTSLIGIVPVFEGTWNDTAFFRIDPETEG